LKEQRERERERVLTHMHTGIGGEFSESFLIRGGAAAMKKRKYVGVRIWIAHLNITMYWELIYWGLVSIRLGQTCLERPVAFFLGNN